LRFSRKLSHHAKGPIPEGAVERSETGGVCPPRDCFRRKPARQLPFPVMPPFCEKVNWKNPQIFPIYKI
jgi:hypothetical protein